jgi:MFS family permease
VILTMWLVGLMQGFGQAQPAATLPFTRAALGLDEASMSSLLAWARLGAVVAVGLSIWADRQGRRRPLLTAYGLLVVASAASGLTTSALGFGGAQAIVRGATSGLSALGVVWLAEHVGPAVRAYGVGLYGAAGSLGAGLAVLGLPLAELDWRLPYFVTGAGIVLFPILARRVEETPRDLRAQRAARLPNLSRPNHNLAEHSRLLRNRLFLTAASAALLPAAYSSLGLSFLTERLVNTVGLSAGNAVLLTLAAGTMGGVGFFLGGRTADTWGRRPATVLALFAILVGGTGVFHLRSPWLIFVSLAISSFGSFAYVPAAMSRRAELFDRDRRATATASLTWIGTLGSVIGLVTGGLLIRRLGLTSTMDLLAVGVVLAILVEGALPETKGRALQPAPNQDPEAAEHHEADRQPHLRQTPAPAED